VSTPSHSAASGDLRSTLVDALEAIEVPLSDFMKKKIDLAREVAHIRLDRAKLKKEKEAIELKLETAAKAINALQQESKEIAAKVTKMENSKKKINVQLAALK
jgi:chromosome segregation ATPase